MTSSTTGRERPLADTEFPASDVPPTVAELFDADPPPEHPGDPLLRMLRLEHGTPPPDVEAAD